MKYFASDEDIERWERMHRAMVDARGPLVALSIDLLKKGHSPAGLAYVLLVAAYKSGLMVWEPEEMREFFEAVVDSLDSQCPPIFEFPPPDKPETSH